MKTQPPVSFETFYFKEMVDKIREKGFSLFELHDQKYLQQLVAFLEEENTAHESIEKLANAPSTSDLAIFFSDLLDQIQTQTPGEAITKIEQHAQDFIDLFQVFMQNEEWKASMESELALERLSTGQEVTTLSFEEFCDHLIRENIEKTANQLSGDLRSSFHHYLNATLQDPELVDNLNQELGVPLAHHFTELHNEIMNAKKDGIDLNQYIDKYSSNLQQWTNTFLELLTQYPSQISEIFQPSSAESSAEPPVEQPEEAERPFESLFEEAESIESIDEEESVTDEVSEIDELLQKAGEWETRPEKSRPLSEEDKERRKFLREYILNEIESFKQEILENVDNLRENPRESQFIKNFKESLKSLRDLGQIHSYKGLENIAINILNNFNELQQRGKTFPKVASDHLKSILEICPDYIDASLQENEAPYLEKIDQRLAAFRSFLVDEKVEEDTGSELLSPATSTEAFQDTVNRWAGKIEHELKGGAANSSLSPLAPIFENLVYWGELFNLPQATQTVMNIQTVLKPPYLHELTPEDHQVINETVSCWQQDFTSSETDHWKMLNIKLEKIKNRFVEIGIGEATEALQEVVRRQLRQAIEQLQSGEENFKANVQHHLPSIFLKLERNSALGERNDLEYLFHNLQTKLHSVEPRVIENQSEFIDQFENYLQALSEEITESSDPLETDDLIDQFDALLRQFTPTEIEHEDQPGIQLDEKDVEPQDVEEVMEEEEFDFRIMPEEEQKEAPKPERGPDEEINEIFTSEARNYLHELQENRQKLTKDIEATYIWHRYGVTAHTLKGSAQMVGRDDIAELTNPLDRTVDLVENGSLNVNAELLEILESFENLIEDRLNDGSSDAEPAIRWLNDYIAKYSKEGVELEPPERLKQTPADEEKQSKAREVEAAGVIELEEQDEELLDIFQNEVANNFDLIEKDLTDLEKFGYNKETSQNIERAIHEIRGAAKMLGISEIAGLTDKLENIFEQLRKEEASSLEDVIPLTRKTMAVIRELTANHQVDEETYGEVIESLERSIEPYAKPSSLDRKVSTKAHPEEQPSESSREFVVKDAAAGEEAQPTSQVLEFYVNEAREQLEDINYLLLKLEKSPENEELQHHLMRCMHTLKGSSGMVNAKQIEALSHRCEEVLDNNLKGEKSLSPELFDLLFEVVDEINYVLNKFEKAGREETHNIENILDKIYKYSEAAIVSEPKREEKERREEPSSKTAKLTKAEEEKEAEKRDTYLRLNIKKMDHLLNLAAELVISNNQFKTQLDRLKNYIPILNKNLKVFRDTEDFMDTLLREGKHLEAELKSYVEDKPGAQEAFRKLSDHLQRALKNVQALQDEVTSVGHNLKENSKTYDENLQKVNKLSNELLDEVMQARLVPINMLFQRFHRPIRDLARQLQKQIRLSLKGEETELDRTLVEELYEPLLHIIRNAIDHGLESGEDRKAAGKDPEGRIEVKAYRDRNQVIIEISDDGQGINVEDVKNSAIERGLLSEADAKEMDEQDLFEYLFYPGFSTAKETTLVSGRGVGLDAVKAQIEKSKGDIRMYTEPGKGTTFSIRVPVSLSVIQSMLVEVNGHVYSIPLMQVEETIHVNMQDLLTEKDQYSIRYRDKKLTVMPLNRLLRIHETDKTNLFSSGDYPVILVQDEGNRVALLVDKIIRREEILIKSLGPGLRRLKYVSGGSIMADGQVVLVLDIPQIIQDILKGSGRFSKSLLETVDSTTKEHRSGKPASQKRQKVQVEGRKPAALIVDDSLSIRKYLSSLLMQRGYITDTARNGYEALELLNKQKFDIMITDLEMPKLSGYELIETLRYDQRFSSFPIVVLTGRAGENFRQLTTELGADAYIVKPFKDQELFEQMDKFIEFRQ